MQLCYMRGTYSKYFQNSIDEAAISSLFLKLLFPQKLNVVIQEFYIHSTYEINSSVSNNFKAILSKTTNDLFQDIYALPNLLF